MIEIQFPLTPTNLDKLIQISSFVDSKLPNIKFLRPLIGDDNPAMAFHLIIGAATLLIQLASLLGITTTDN